jgi:hypothetical protein
MLKGHCTKTENTKPSKIPRPASVDDGVHARVDPSEPSDDGDDSFRIVNARLAESREQISDEERQPTSDEHAHHDAQCPVFLILNLNLLMEFFNLF